MRELIDFVLHPLTISTASLMLFLAFLYQHKRYVNIITLWPVMGMMVVMLFFPLEQDSSAFHYVIHFVTIGFLVAFFCIVLFRSVLIGRPMWIEDARIDFGGEVKEEKKEEPPAPTPQPTPEPLYTEPSDTLRFSHTLILAGTGHGKTSLIRELVLKDVGKPCTTIVFDSQGDLFSKLARLNVPRSRVVLIDPTDIQYPLSLGLFDFTRSGDSPFEKERSLNSVVELLSYVINSLLDAKLTAKMELPLRYAIRLCMEIPGANIHTLRSIFSKDGVKENQLFINNLSESAQDFFHTEFDSKEYTETKAQILRRIYSVLENQTMERMFSATKTKLNIRELLDEGSIILVNTAKDFLKDEGSKFFTRFIVALIANAIQERNPNKDNMPVYLYIDEAAPVLDPMITNLLETARKYKLGVTLAFQSLGQIPYEIQHSVIANTKIKYAGGVSAKDARALAEDMRMDASLINSTKPLHFKTYHPELTSGVFWLYSHITDPSAIDKEEKRSDFKELLAENRAKYSTKEVKKEETKKEEGDDLAEFT